MFKASDFELGTDVVSAGSSAPAPQPKVQVYRASRMNDLDVISGLSRAFVESEETFEAVIVPMSKILKMEAASKVQDLFNIGVVDRLKMIEKRAAEKKLKYIAFIEEIERQIAVLVGELERIETKLPDAQSLATSVGDKLSRAQKLYDDTFQYRQLAEVLHQASSEDDDGSIGASQFISEFSPEVKASLQSGTGDSWFEAKEQEISTLILKHRTDCQVRDQLIHTQEEVVLKLRALIADIESARVEHEGFEKDYENAVKYLLGENKGNSFRRTRLGALVLGRIFSEEPETDVSARHSRAITQGVEYGN